MELVIKGTFKEIQKVLQVIGSNSEQQIEIAIDSKEISRDLSRAIRGKSQEEK